MSPPSPPPLERPEEIGPELVGRMVDEVLVGGGATLDKVFTQRGAPAPSVTWTPASASLPMEGHRFVLDQWDAARAGLKFPPVAAIDPMALKPVLGNVILLDVLDGGGDFRFRLYGTVIAEAARFDWTGMTVDEMRRTLKGPGPALFLATYRAMLRRPEPVYTVNSAMVVFQNRAWGRLVVPYGDAASGRVDRLLVANYVVTDDFVSDDEERRLEQLRHEMRATREKIRTPEKP